MLIQLKDIEGENMCLIYAKGSDFKRNHEVITEAINQVKEKYDDYDIHSYDAMRDYFFECLAAQGFECINVEDNFEVDFL